MLKITCCFFTVLLLLNCERRSRCQYPLNIAVGDLKMGAKLTLWIDEMDKKEFIAPYYFAVSKTQGILFNNFCNDKKLISLKVSINEIDTAFSVDPKNIYKVYLGQDPQKNYKSFLVQFIYRENYNGYKPNKVIFDD